MHRPCNFSRRKPRYLLVNDFDDLPDVEKVLNVGELYQTGAVLECDVPVGRQNCGDVAPVIRICRTANDDVVSGAFPECEVVAVGGA